MESTAYLTKSTSQILKTRFREDQQELRQKKCIKLGDFRDYVLDKEPEFNCPDGWKKIEETWYGRTPNIRVVELMQEYKTKILAS